MLTARLEGFDAMNRRLAVVDTVTAAVLNREMTASLLMLEADARQHVRQDTRRLAGSITSRVEGAGLALTGSVGPSARYGIVVERGRRAGAKMPPVEALMPWVGRHFGLSGPARRRAAFLVARKIARRGIPARPYMAPAFRRQLPGIRRRFTAVGVAVVASLTGGRR